MNWPFHHYVMAFFICGDIIGSEIYFDMSTAITTFFWLVQDDIYVSILFFELCIFIFKMHVLGSQHSVGTCFFLSSLTICPLIVALKPFLFYVNVDVLDLSLPCCYVWSVGSTWSPCSFPSFSAFQHSELLKMIVSCILTFFLVVVLCERINLLCYYMLARSRNRSP